MDESLISPSVYNTANESSPSTPRPFFTPLSSRKASESPSYHASYPEELQSHLRTSPSPPSVTATESLLRRCVESYDPLAAQPSSPTTPEMPVTTRGQERAAGPNPQTPSAGTIREQSPVVQEDVLRGLSPHSPSYARVVEEAVENVIRRLMSHARIREGHGVRELYIQSFKDAGSKDLLDALLRNRATERQRIDFKRYVDDVNKLKEPPPVVMVPAKDTLTTVLGKRTRSGSDYAFEPTITYKRTIVANTDSYAPPQEAEPILTSNTGEEIGSSDPNFLDVQTLESMHADNEQLDTVARTRPESSTPKMRRGRRKEDHSQKDRIVPLGTTPGVEIEPALTATNAATTSRVESILDLQQKSRAHEAMLNPTHQRPAQHRLGTQSRKNRMFIGANGPIYSSGLDMSSKRFPGR